MSVARSAYRQLLRVGRAVSDKYADPNDMCFALFGLLVTRHDFVNAGYGSTFPAILRTCFLRPSLRDDPHDSVSCRISAAFDALRRLNEINASQMGFRVRELRRQLEEMAEERDAAASGDAAATDGKRVRRGEGVKSAFDDAASPGEGTNTASTAPQASPTSSAASSGTSAATGEKKEADGVAAATSKPLDAAASPSSSGPASGAAAVPSKTGTTVYRLDEGVDMMRGSVLIERSSRRRIQNFPRHCVVCEPISMVFPPYRFCVPPEPAYLLAVRNEFALHGISDVLLALSATSIVNSHHQARLREAEGASRASEEENTEEQADAAAAASTQSTTAAAAAPASSSSKPTPRGFPTTHAELHQLVKTIPTRTVVQTDVLEVEITTEYVCSNPASTSSTTTTAAASSSTSAASTAAQRKRSSAEGAFSTATPLKSASSSPAASSSSSSSSSTSTKESSTAGPGAPPAEDDDTKAHLFLYYVYVRNRGPKMNPHRWHAQVLSHHLVVVDVAQAQVLEMGRPGVMGNFPLLPPGASHCFESGTTLSGPEGILRGSIQVNLFNDAGEMVTLDAAIAPTRLTVEVTSAHDFTSGKSAKEELVQRTSEDKDDDEGDSAGNGV